MTSLADQIIEHGPYEPGDIPWPFELAAASQANALRDELIEGRRLRKAAEARERFAVDSYIGPFGQRVITQLECRYCDWAMGTSTRVDLAELDRRADEHTEGCA